MQGNKLRNVVAILRAFQLRKGFRGVGSVDETKNARE